MKIIKYDEKQLNEHNKL